RNVFNQTNQKRGLQQEALVYSVYAAGENIDSLENIEQLVERIAEKHVSLGVKPEQYPIVGEALIQAVEDILGESATDEVIEAWRAAYDYIANLFIEIEQKKYHEREQQEGGWTGFREIGRASCRERTRSAQLAGGRHTKHTERREKRPRAT